eukprot:GFYU01001985.1.p1 GENE.GFYU01001985.1~~GFYU01001985.1.p1  ORF type:complete len:328 (-),score=45.39 GFYU01001985.1:336-1319(-)
MKIEVLSSLCSPPQESPPPVSRPKFAQDSDVTECARCRVEFTTLVRKHHCRRCGDIFCRSCSSYQVKLSDEYGYNGKRVRCCTGCAMFEKCPIRILPPDLMIRILSNLSPKEVCSTALVCHEFAMLALDDEVWRQLYQRDYGYLGTGWKRDPSPNPGHGWRRAYEIMYCWKTVGTLTLPTACWGQYDPKKVDFHKSLPLELPKSVQKPDDKRPSSERLVLSDNDRYRIKKEKEQAELGGCGHAECRTESCASEGADPVKNVAVAPSKATAGSGGGVGGVESHQLVVSQKHQNTQTNTPPGRAPHFKPTPEPPSTATAVTSIATLVVS